MNSLTKEIEKSSAELNLLYERLGERAIPWHKAISYSPSYESFSKIEDLIKQKDGILKEIQAVTNALSEVNTSDLEIKKTKLTLNDLKKQLNSLISSIGAVAVETERAGKLPEVLLPCMRDYKDYMAQEQELTIKKIGSKSIAKTLAQMQLKKHQSELETVFSKVGHAVFYSNYSHTLPSEKAKTLIAMAKETERLIETNSDNIDKKMNAVDMAQNSLQQMGVYHIENRHLRSLESQVDAIDEKLKSLFIEYGRILSAGIDTWMDMMAPEELQKSCNIIKDQQRRIRELKLNLELLDTEREIEIHQAQTEQLASQLSHINSQLSILERQKTDIQIKLEEEKKTMEAIKEKQNIINSRFQ